MRRTFLGAAALVALLQAACSSPGSTAPQPSPSPSAPAPSPVPSASSGSGNRSSIPDGVYVTTITRADTNRSGDGHIINLGSLLVGRYRMTARAGSFSISLDGRTAVPTPSPRRTGGEGAYATYGFWIFLGVPPIGDGRYGGSSSRVVFRSTRGACFQQGVARTLSTGTYRWRLRGDELLLSPPKQEGASGDGCLGRRFVLTAHLWHKVA